MARKCGFWLSPLDFMTIRVFRLRVRLYIVCENLLILAPKTPAPIKVWLDQLVEVLSVFGRGVLPMNLKRAMH